MITRLSHEKRQLCAARFLHARAVLVITQPLIANFELHSRTRRSTRMKSGERGCTARRRACG